MVSPKAFQVAAAFLACLALASAGGENQLTVADVAGECKGGQTRTVSLTWTTFKGYNYHDASYVAVYPEEEWLKLHSKYLKSGHFDAPQKGIHADDGPYYKKIGIWEVNLKPGVYYGVLLQHHSHKVKKSKGDLKQFQKFTVECVQSNLESASALADNVINVFNAGEGTCEHSNTVRSVWVNFATKPGYIWHDASYLVVFTNAEWEAVNQQYYNSHKAIPMAALTQIMRSGRIKENPYYSGIGGWAVTLPQGDYVVILTQYRGVRTYSIPERDIRDIVYFNVNCREETPAVPEEEASSSAAGDDANGGNASSGASGKNPPPAPGGDDSDDSDAANSSGQGAPAANNNTPKSDKQGQGQNPPSGSSGASPIRGNDNKKNQDDDDDDDDNTSSGGASPQPPSGRKQPASGSKPSKNPAAPAGPQQPQPNASSQSSGGDDGTDGSSGPSGSSGSADDSTSGIVTPMQQHRIIEHLKAQFGCSALNNGQDCGPDPQDPAPMKERRWLPCMTRQVQVDQCKSKGCDITNTGGQFQLGICVDKQAAGGSSSSAPDSPSNTQAPPAGQNASSGGDGDDDSDDVVTSKGNSSAGSSPKQPTNNAPGGGSGSGSSSRGGGDPKGPLTKPPQLQAGVGSSGGDGDEDSDDGNNASSGGNDSTPTSSGSSSGGSEGVGIGAAITKELAKTVDPALKKEKCDDLTAKIKQAEADLKNIEDQIRQRTVKAEAVCHASSSA